jgi:hypothetical protein
MCRLLVDEGDEGDDDCDWNGWPSRKWLHVHGRLGLMMMLRIGAEFGAQGAALQRQEKRWREGSAADEVSKSLPALVSPSRRLPTHSTLAIVHSGRHLGMGHVT